MRNASHGKTHNQAWTKTRTASLSVVVVCSESARNARDVTQTLQAAAHDLAPQLIVVAEAAGDSAMAASIERLGAEFVLASRGSTRAQMCDLGMQRARGTIVAVRDVETVGNASWLNAYRGILSHEAVSPEVPETVVMDTLVASADSPLADRLPSDRSVEDLAPARSVEMMDAAS